MISLIILYAKTRYVKTVHFGIIKDSLKYQASALVLIIFVTEFPRIRSPLKLHDLSHHRSSNVKVNVGPRANSYARD